MLADGEGGGDAASYNEAISLRSSYKPRPPNMGKISRHPYTRYCTRSRNTCLELWIGCALVGDELDLDGLHGCDREDGLRDPRPQPAQQPRPGGQVALQGGGGGENGSCKQSIQTPQRKA